MKKGILNHNPNTTRQLACLTLVFALLTATIGVTASGQKMQATQTAPLSEEQRILHVLNRLGFGPRPGDIERVKRMGLQNYLNQQLHPETIADDTAEAKVRNLATLNMTTAELYEKYPQPNRLLQQLQRRGELPSDLAALRESRVKGNANATQPQDPQRGTQEMQGPTSSPAGSQKAVAQTDALTNPANPLGNEKYRQALREYYASNGLQLPQRIVAELQTSRILRAVYSERQLQEVMVDFWTNHFNVFAGKGVDRWLLTAYDRDTIRPNALGKFSDLLVATAKSPAMLFYLDNFQSVSPQAPTRNAHNFQRRREQRRDSLFDIFMNPRRDRRMEPNPNVGVQQAPVRPNMTPAPARARRGINENYARELMELHTLGVDGGYTQKDVQEVARCFTGWTIFAPRGAGAAAAAILGIEARDNAGSFYFNPRVHDDGEKIVLGHRIPAGGGIKDGLMVLDILDHHRSTARFIATKLVRHFVSDTPPPALVERVASTYQKTDGDIRQMLSTIFSSPEFNSPEAFNAKIKRPFELAVSAVRTLGADTIGGPQFHQWIARMGQPLYGFQTPNGYSDTAEAWVNTGALLERLNFGLALASNRIPGTSVDLKHLVSEGGPDKAKALDAVINAVAPGQVSAATKETILKQIDNDVVSAVDGSPAAQMQRPADMNAGLRRQQQAPRDVSITDPVTRMVGLILGSPEFQRQ